MNPAEQSGFTLHWRKDEYNDDFIAGDLDLQVIKHLPSRLPHLTLGIFPKL